MNQKKQTSFLTKYSFYIELFFFFTSLYLHLMLSVSTPTGDSVYFSNVMQRLVNQPFFGFYSESGITYPPLFNYFYYIIAKILTYFQIPLTWQNRFFIFGVKFPCICAEFTMIGFVYQTAKKHGSNVRVHLWLLFLLLFQPGYVFATAYICQVDALYTCFIFFTVYLMMTKHLKTAYFCFAAGILFKFQTIFIAPLLLFAVIDQVILTDFSLKRFFSHLFAGIAALGCIPLSYLPFVINVSSHDAQAAGGGLVQNFSSSVSGYGRASTNAYNFWTLLGYNLKYDTKLWGIFSCRTWGTLFILVVVVVSGFLFFKHRSNPAIYPAIAAFLISGIFCFSMRMMARYLYPAIILFFLAYAKKPSKQRHLCAILFSLGFFANVWCDYMVYPYDLYRPELVIPYIISAFLLFCFGYSVFILTQE